MSQESSRAQADEVSFGPLAETDLEGISRLVTRMSDDRGVRLRDKSAAYYRWMYLRNPSGKAIVYSGRAGGEVVASFALAPKRFQVGGESVVVGKTMDMFTDPAYQGQGLMGRCTSEVFGRAAAAGIHGWYVTPSVNSFPIFKERWGYTEPFVIIFRARILQFEPVLAAMGRPKLARAVGGTVDRLLSRIPRRKAKAEAEVLSEFGEEIDRLWEAVAGGYPVATVRDSAYLTWRYLENPDEYTVLGLRREGVLAGIVVLAETVRRGVLVGEIVDFLCAVDDESTFRALLAAAMDHSDERGHALVQAWSIRATKMDARIRRAGLRLKRTEVKFLISPGLTGVADPEAWLLTQGDGNDV